MTQFNFIGNHHEKCFIHVIIQLLGAYWWRMSFICIQLYRPCHEFQRFAIIQISFRFLIHAILDPREPFFPHRSFILPLSSFSAFLLNSEYQWTLNKGTNSLVTSRLEKKEIKKRRRRKKNFYKRLQSFVYFNGRRRKWTNIGEN